MVQGVEVDLFRPTTSSRSSPSSRSRSASADALRDAAMSTTTLAAVAGEPGGSEWLAAWEAAQDPWFNYSSGNGFYCTDKVWLDHLDIPLGFIRDYVGRARSGRRRSTGRPRRSPPSATGSRPSIAALLPTTRREPRSTGSSALRASSSRTSRTTTSTSSTGPCRSSGGRCASSARCSPTPGFWTNADDMFYLRREEIQEALFDYGNGWAVGAEPIGPVPLARRDRAAQGDRRCPRDEAPARRRMNEPPEVVTEPFTIMLWGITDRERRQMARRLGRRRRADRYGRLAGHRRGKCARRSVG